MHRIVFTALLVAPVSGLLASPALALHSSAQPRWPAPVLRPAPAMSLALPTCTAAGVLGVAARAGSAGALTQLGLFAIFRKSPDPILSRSAGYSAHSVITFALMIFCAVFGLAGWLSPPATAVTAAGRLLAVSDSARWLAAALLGMLLVWDIPTCLRIQRLRKPDMLGHHVAMAATALVGATALPTHYGLYYMGVVELSSIPLTAYDQYDRAYEVGKSLDEVSAERKQRLRSMRDLSRAIAAAVFIVVRAFDFTRVTLTKFVPDALAVLSSPATSAAFVLPLRFMIVSSVCFAGLQLYWFSMFVRISLAQRAREKRKFDKKRAKDIAAE